MSFGAAFCADSISVQESSWSPDSDAWAHEASCRSSSVVENPQLLAGESALALPRVGNEVLLLYPDVYRVGLELKGTENLGLCSFIIELISSVLLSLLKKCKDWFGVKLAWRFCSTSFEGNDKNAIKFSSADLAVNNNLHWGSRGSFCSLEGKEGRNTGGLQVGAKWGKATSKEPPGETSAPCTGQERRSWVQAQRRGDGGRW